ncbi:uncharacterized protein LOC123723083 [Papilio machaon]|uniref:uncharacterized protein LOC123723083 n=1 Tax=Papilio machaon TaxID=76193 RepID=UPI001E664590|nr:uncharacterized protein LOC123723083 [Papilio machaon]
MTAEECAETFFRGWIARFGVPALVTTDQGRQFESSLFTTLMQMCGSRRVRTTSYHPCANGLVERMHRQLKASLMCHEDTWHKTLPVVLLGMRAALKEDLQCSPAQLVYGEPLRLPGEFLASSTDTLTVENVSNFATQLRLQMARLRPTPASRHGQHKVFVLKDLLTATHVFLRDDTVRPSLKQPYSGPHKVVSRTEKTITITVGDKNTQVSLDRVKPAYILDSSAPAPSGPIDKPSASVTPAAAPAVPAASTVPPACHKRDTPPSYTTRAGRTVRFKDRLDL